MAEKTGKNSAAASLIVRSMEEVMHDSMLPYAEYVILDRAIPRVEDGLKPVQRRILYTMQDLGIVPDKPHRKSARIVGDCLGKYHPHGDSSVYDAMVRMAQGFNMSAPLVDGHGNFGSVDGDPAAAMRYTEARMAPLALELLRDIEKDTVNYSLNFDDTLKEPDVLPGRFPNLLVNGATGIAVGLATNIPPHNLSECIDATIAMLADPDIPLKKVMKKIKGPDFPTGGFLLEGDGIEQAYRNGKGRIVMRAKTHFETQKNGKQLIVVDELPYQVNKANALEKILKLTEDKKNLFSSIATIRDESDRNGMRAVVELKKGADAEKILQLLFKYSDLQLNFGVNMVAIADGKPQQLGLLDILRHYIRHQKDVLTRRTRYDLEAAERRAHILEGLIVAIDHIDQVIALIQASQNGGEARAKLMAAFAISDAQAQAVLDMRLQRLTSLQMVELRKELADLEKKMGEYRAILSDDAALVAVIQSELKEIKKRYGQPRRTEILDAKPDIDVDEREQIPAEEAMVCFTDMGLKRYNSKAYEKALDSGALAEEGRMHFLLPTMTNRRLLVLTNHGNAFSLPVSELPEPKGKEKGIIPSGLFAAWEDGETIVQIIDPVAARETARQEDPSLYFFTRQGLVKRTALSQYETRSKRIAAIKLREGDSVLAVCVDQGGSSVLCISRQGMAIRFATETIPESGRVSAGVRTMKLEGKDELIYATELSGDGGEVLVLTERGYAKRSLLLDYDIQGRGGKGLKTIDFRKNGANGTRLVAARYLDGNIRMTIVQALGQVTVVDSADVWMEPRFAKGQPVVMALVDDVVTAAYPVLLAQRE